MSTLTPHQESWMSRSERWEGFWPLGIWVHIWAWSGPPHEVRPKKRKNWLGVPNILGLCPLCGFDNSETSVNRKIELALNRKIGFSEFVPGFEKFAWCVKSRSRDVDFLSLIPGRYRHQKLKRSAFLTFLFFQFLIFEPGAKKTPFPKALGTLKELVFVLSWLDLFTRQRLWSGSLSGSVEQDWEWKISPTHFFHWRHQCPRSLECLFSWFFPRLREPDGADRNFRRQMSGQMT